MATNILKRNKKKTKQHASLEETKVEGIDFISPSIVKEIIPSDETIEGIANDYYVEIGGTTEFHRYYRSFFAEITGGTTYAGMFDDLLIGNFGEGDSNVAIHIDPVDSSEELDNIGRRIRGLESDLYSEKNDQKAQQILDEINDLKEKQRRIRTNVEKPFRASIQITASAADLKKLKKYTNKMIRKMKGKDILLRPPDGKQLESLINMTPLGKEPVYQEHTFTYESTNIADFFPFGNGKISHKTGVVWGVDHLDRPIFFDPWDKSLTSRNMVVTGVSGAGKTFAVMTLMNRMLHKGIRIALVDPKGDYEKFTLANNLPYIELDADTSNRINIFDVDIETLPNGQERVALENTIQGVKAIVFKMIRLLDENALDGIAKVKIDNMIRELYREKGITVEPDSIYKTEIELAHDDEFDLTGVMKEMPTLSDLYLLMKDDPETVLAARLIKDFTKQGVAPEKAIFDGQSTVRLQDAPMFAFGLSGLDEEIMMPLGIFIATKWTSAKFTKKNRHQRKMVFIDEIQIPMEDLETARWVEQEYRTVRFFNSGICGISQGMEVFTKSISQGESYGLGILKNAPTKLYMKQDTLDIDSISKDFGLTSWEADFLINTADKGLGLLKVKNESSQIFFEATPNEYALFTTDPDDLIMQGDADEENIPY